MAFRRHCDAPVILIPQGESTVNPAHSDKNILAHRESDRVSLTMMNFDLYIHNKHEPMGTHGILTANNGTSEGIIAFLYLCVRIPSACLYSLA